MAYPSPISHDRAAEVSGPARAARLLPGALFVLLLLAVYADPVFLRRNFAGRDPILYHYPLEKAIHDAYARGRLPVWISEISGGRPLLANPNVGALYPVRPLLSRFSFPFAMRLFPLLHWAGAGIGMILLLQTLGASRAGAWIGAVTYTFSGASVSYVFYPNSHPGMMLLPWIVWGIARPASVSRGALILSIFWMLIMLAGDVFPVSLAFLGSLLWILLETEARERSARFLRLAVALGLAGLAAAPQLVASALWIPETNRAVLGMRLGDVVLFSISPFRLLELAIPFPFGTTWELDRTQVWGWPLYHGKQIGYFSGLYAGAFALMALVATWNARPAGARFARSLLLVGLALSVPLSFLPDSWGDWHSPVPLRYPEKFAVSLSLALAMLSGVGFDAWKKSRVRTRWLLVAGSAFALVAAAAALSPGLCGRMATRVIGADPGLAGVAGQLLPGALAEAGLLWMATVVAVEMLGRNTRRSVLACLALLTLVPIAANRKIARTFSEQSLFTPSPFDRFIRKVDPRQDFRTFDETSYSGPSALEGAEERTDASRAAYGRRSWLVYTHALWDRGTVFNGDLDGGDLSRLESLRRISFRAAGFGDSQAFFGALALKWGARLRDQKPLAGYRRIRGDALLDWDEHEAPFPDIRLVERWREETGALPALSSLPLLKAGDIVIESGSTSTGKARPGSLRILEKTPERLRVEAEAPEPTWLFVLRDYFSYRTVLLDGNPVENAPAQLAFSAVRVPAGRHTIDWKESVPGGRISRWGPVLFVLAATLLWRRKTAVISPEKA